MEFFKRLFRMENVKKNKQMKKMYKIGETVLYENKETVIEDIVDDKYKIINPYWEEDEDDKYMPFWIYVEEKDLCKKL